MRNLIVEILESGTGACEGISEDGISHSVVPTLCGPRGLGRVGIGLRYDEIILVGVTLQLAKVVSGLVLDNNWGVGLYLFALKEGKTRNGRMANICNCLKRTQGREEGQEQEETLNETADEVVLNEGLLTDWGWLNE